MTEAEKEGIMHMLNVVIIVDNESPGAKDERRMSDTTHAKKDERTEGRCI